MSESRIITSMKEAVAISNGELPEDSYRVHIPANSPHAKPVEFRSNTPHSSPNKFVPRTSTATQNNAPAQ
jgi:hypothetical protein